LSCTFTVEYELTDLTRRDEAMELAAEGKAMMLDFGATEIQVLAQMTPTGGGRLYRWVAHFESMSSYGTFMDSVASNPEAAAVFGRFNGPNSPWRALTSSLHREVPVA
jgi:hypothetical protein